MISKNDVLFGKYEIEALIGSGNFGEVYRVREVETDRILALKILRASASQTDFTEASLLGQLAHPNIVQFYTYEKNDRQLAFVMEYMNGGSLADLCDLEGSLSPEKATSLMIQVCKGMEFAHSKNVIHRDLKPENILINTDGKVKVADFGVAKALAEKSAASTTIGTPYYMAPEQFDGKYGIGVDVYALGCIFYHLLKGAPPFTGTHGEVVKGHLMKAPQIPAHWPQPVSELLESCLAKDPDKRPANAGMFLKQLELLAKLEEDPDATHIVKRSATMFAQKKSKDPRLVKEPEDKAAGNSAGRSNDEQAQTLVEKAEYFMDQGDFTKARKYFELAKEADNNFVSFAERTDQLEKQEKVWLHKQEAEKALSSGDLTKAQSAMKSVEQLTGEEDAWLTQFQAKISEAAEKQHQEKEEREQYLATLWHPDLKMVEIPAGTFMMGASPDDKEANDSEKPQHEVTVTKPFRMMIYPVTQDLYEKVMGNNPSSFKGDPKCPVEMVSWFDAVNFCTKLSNLERLSPYYHIEKRMSRSDNITCDLNANGYRLPTEAEWERACRAGTTGAQYGLLDEIAWHYGNSDKTTHPVGKKQANTFGLYDMLGNVWEWCNDWYVWDYYSSSPANNPAGPGSGSARVLRGGSWGDTAGTGNLRSSVRGGGYAPDSAGNCGGFRCVRDIEL